MRPGRRKAKAAAPRAIPAADPQPLRQACIDQALAIIEKEGLEHLSLREVARRLNVSHQAPYKHFTNREHILTEAMGKAFAGFAAYLRARPPCDDPIEDLASLGAAYLAYALKHPAQYRLMFGAPLPDNIQAHDLQALAGVPFALLHDIIARFTGRSDPEEIRRDALFAWSAVHGLASILQTQLAGRVGFQQSDLTDLISHELRRIAAGLRVSQTENRAYVPDGE